MPVHLLTRRRFAALTAAVPFASCTRNKGTGYPGYALIATSGEKSLAIVDLLSFRLIKTLPLDAAPTAVLTAASVPRSYILTPGSGSVHVVDPSLRIVARTRLAAELSQVLLTHDNAHLLAISSVSREFFIVDTNNLSILRRYKLHAEPLSLDVNSEGDAAIALRGTPNLMLFPRSGSPRQTNLDAEPGSIRFRFDGKLLIAARPSSRALSIVTVPDLQLMANLPLAMRPDNLCFTPDGGQLFVTGDGMDAVAIVFPYKTLEVEQTILAGRSPGVMACSTDPPFLFVASSDGSDLLILDIDTRRVIGLVEVGLHPAFITTTPDNQYALILNRGSNDLAVLRIPAIRPSYQKKNGAALFTLLPVGSTPVHAGILNRA